MGALIAICEFLYKHIKRKRYEARFGGKARMNAPGSGEPTETGKRQDPPSRVFPMPAVTPYVIVRRDGAVWAGPWKNDGRSFTRVLKNWWKFTSKEKAEKELESNDFLTGCTIEEAE